MVKPTRRAAMIGLTLALAGCDGEPPRAEDLRKIVGPGSPNSYLICGKGLCAAQADEDAPVFDLPPGKLLAATIKVASRQPNTSAADADNALAQLVFVQRTPYLRFPDVVRVQAIALPDGKSALALYSHSVYGYRDFGVNGRRARDWVAAIKAELNRS